MVKQAQIDNLCRLCLKNNDSCEDIFENSDSNSLVLRIMACVSLEVHKSDNLPKRICTQCRYQLEKTYIFRSKCRENDTRLRRHVKLLAAGKGSTILEELDDDDEEEFKSSLQFIKTIDNAKDEQNKKELEAKLLAHETSLRSYWDQELQKMQDDIKKEAHNQRRSNAVDVGVGTCHFELLSCADQAEEHTETYSQTETVLNSDSFSKDLESNFMRNIDHSIANAEIEIETIEEQPHQEEQSSSESLNDNAENHENVVKNEEEIISYLEDEILMDVDGLEDEEENADSIAGLNDDLQPSFSESENMINQEKETHSQRFFITEVSDSETYTLDNELTQEEHNLYGAHTDICDDSDEDLEAVTNAVKAELAEQPGFNIGENCIMKVEKDRDLTKVEVRANDGSIICMEFSTEPKKKQQSSLRELQTKMKSEFKCPHCSIAFYSVKPLMEHVKATHPENSKGQICDVCGKWCPTKSSLERHYRTHTGEKPFGCGECGRSFVQKEILKRHMLVHTGEKPFTCSSCPKRFNQKDQLRLHINMAHADNPIVTLHKCHMCDKEFKYVSGLSRHLASHYGRTFPCECGKVFNDRSALKRHVWALHERGKNRKSSKVV